MVVNRSRIITPGYGDLTLGGDELEELKSLGILGLNLDSKLTFKIHLREVVPKAASSLGSVRRAVNSFDCSRVLKCCFNACVCPASSIVPPCGCPQRSFIKVC